LISGRNWLYHLAGMSQLDHPGNPGTEGEVRQSVLPLRVAVCAWCKPRELGAGLGDLSHGICPRHFREMKAKLQKSRSGKAGEPVRPRARRSRKLCPSDEEIAQLGLLFPALFAGASSLSGPGQKSCDVS
jgi:hypothetical protein